jgi:hypothetical protein
MYEQSIQVDDGMILQICGFVPLYQELSNRIQVRLRSPLDIRVRQTIGLRSFMEVFTPPG